MASIYDTIARWYTENTYVKNHIVEWPENSNDYWYSLEDSNKSNEPSIGSPVWGGFGTTDILGITKPQFFWPCSYNQSTSISPRVLTIRYGDGYTQRIPDGINNNLLNLELSFDGRDEQETLAIIHFLNVRRASEAFLYTPPAPFATERLFVCKKISSTVIFRDNFNIKVSFEEVPD